jgi:hypothetical protein
MPHYPPKSRYTNRWAILWVILAGILASCAPLVREGQTAIYQQDDRIDAEESAGQTFISTYAGLAEIRVYLAPDSPGNGRLVLHLRETSADSTDIAADSIPLAEIDGGGYYVFNFNPQKNSFLKSYFFFIEIEGNGVVRYGSAGPTDYLNGSLYQNGRPVDGQMAFQLAYDPAKLAFGLLREGAGWVGWLGAAGIFFVLPGITVIRAWSPSISRLGALTLASGFSMAAYPLLLLWGQVFHLRPGVWYAWGLAGLCTLFWFAWLLQGKWSWKSLFSGFGWRSSNFVPDLFFFIVVGLVAFTRLWAFRSAPAPLWGDSVQHTVMAQLILDNGGLFKSWEPYAPYHSLTVQFGFSAAAAVWAWVTHQPIQQAVVVFGQILNTLAVIAWYPLACRLAKGNRWAGVVAVLVAGLLTSVPGYYSNWGRYAQLAGQTVLPAALWVSWDMLERKRFDGRGVLLLGACLAGMLLCYYRMAFYYASFVLVLMVVHWLPGTKSWMARWKGLAGLAGAALVLVLLLIPWILQVSGSDLAGRVIQGVTNQTPLQSLSNDYASWRDVTAFVSLPLLVIAGLAGAAGLLRRQWLIPGLLIWTALLAVVRAASVIKFPGANMMMSTAVIYFLYVPVGLLVGWLIGEMMGWLHPRWRIGWMVGVALLATAALLGARSQSRIMQPSPYTIVTWPDMQAARWIRANTPPEAAFLVEGFRIYAGSTAVGSDAGWWLPLLAGRSNSMPPQYALVEKSVTDGYTQRVINLVDLLEEQSPSSPKALPELCSWGITHVYIGQQRGLASFERLQLFAPEDLEAGPNFELIYAQDRVRIYAFDNSVCR